VQTISITPGKQPSEQDPGRPVDGRGCQTPIKFTSKLKKLPTKIDQHKLTPEDHNRPIETQRCNGGTEQRTLSIWLMVMVFMLERS
jgi:hypothetical protein